MGYNLFQRPGAGSSGTAGDDEFASTVASLPTAGDSRLPELADSQSGDSQPADSQPADSQPAGIDSGLLDSQPAPADTDPVLPAEQRPTIAHIGRYALKGPLGTGGLGQVHEAWDPLLSRVVAVKTLQFETDPRERVALDGLFLNEARAVASLNHPHIVTIYDAGLSPHGVYIAMERLHGRDLRHALASGWQPTPAQAALLVRRVADALAYAHARGVVHCDIKPANIFLGKRDKPKVLDFGIARVAHGRPSSHLEGFVLGSPHYLAPEQLEGREVDARTDIHALGVVFYELLAGRRAFAGDSVEQISTAILTHHPAPAHEVRPEVPRALSIIAAKAMARDAEQRYHSALAMAMDLRRWLDSHAASQPARPQAESTKGTRRHVPPRRRALLWAGGAVAGAALLAVAVGAARRSAAPTAAMPTVAPQPAPAVAAPASVPTLPVAAEVAMPAATSEPPPPVPTSPPAPPAVAMPRAAAPAPRPAATASPAPRPRSAAAAPPVATPAVAAAAPAVANGTLQLAISPWGEVEVDGRVVGTAPPLTRLALTAGSHQVVVRNADFPPLTTTVQVDADGVTVLRHRFVP